MKKLFLICTVLAVFLTGCSDPTTGAKYESLVGKELPPELKGLKVYYVNAAGPEYTAAVYVAVLGDSVNSLTYREEKVDRHVIMVGSGKKERIIYAKEIISETDSVIVLHK